jgi:unsaturated chondroitin disaccharide hydrolase
LPAALAAAVLCLAPSASASSRVSPAPGLGAGPFAASTLDPTFAEQARLARVLARQRLVATEEGTPRRRYAYYTLGDVGWKYTGPAGWAAGFVPGALWSGYQMTGGGWWLEHARSRQRAIGEEEVTAASVNLGALFYPSFAKGYALTGDPALRRTALRAAKTMALRYDPEVGAMLSRSGLEFNVIIDSLMKSQLLWWAAKNGADSDYAGIARQHALTIARDFVRPDGSTWHLIYYDALTGAVTRRDRGSAWSADSTWARGQAWAILGFAAAYRETRDARFLAAARKCTDWYLAHLPADEVPFWDFADPAIPDSPRDSSAAAIAASGIVDLALAEPSPVRRAAYLDAARGILSSLMSPAYFSAGANPAVLLHGTYLWRSGIVDRGLAYGDAFFLEALLRLRRTTPQVAALDVVRARAEKGVPAGALDGDFDTSWVSRGKASLDLRLSGTQQVGAVRVALAGGDRRAAVLRVSVSQDGVRWRRVLRTVTSGETAGLETLDFAATAARWVRVSCGGTTAGPVNRLAEVRVLPPL